MLREQTPRAHQMHKKSLVSMSGIRCPKWTDDQPCWIWKAWIDLLSSGLALENSGAPRPCRVPKPKPWIPSQPGIIVMTHHHISPSQSRPGPKSGGRPNHNVPHGAPDQSTGARVTGDCHSPVEPKVPHVGSNGKPWREQKSQLVQIGTAPAGSLYRWSSHGHSPKTLFTQYARILPRPQPLVVASSKRDTSVIPILGVTRSLYMYSACERRMIFCLVYKARIPVRLIRTVAPALLHLTRSMIKGETRVSRHRPPDVGESLDSSPSQMCEALSEAPEQTSRRPALTRPAQHRTSSDRRPARPDPSVAYSDTVPTGKTCSRSRQPLRCPLVSRALLGLLLSSPLPAAGGRLPHSDQASYRHDHSAPAAASDALQVTSSLSSARKRAYKRAVRRASQHPDQHTMYRGRACTLQQLCKGYQGRQPRPKPQQQTQLHALQRSQTRLLVLSWNAGGLSSNLWQELLLTLDHLAPEARPQVICIQESHWGDQVAPSFITAQWSVYTSPSTDNKAAGLLVLLDRKSLPSGEVLTADPKPGRIQHIRLTTAHWTADILHVYQKPYNFHPKALQDAKKLRAEIWSVLEAQLQRIPKRHTLMIVGDFNCPLKSYPQAGPRIQAGGSTMPPDQARLQNLVEDYGLTHLNSWCKAAGPTFVHAKGASLIDHLLMRTSQTDNRAKQAKPVDLALAAWRLGGKHLPVQASLPVVPFHSLNRPAKPKRAWNHWEVVQLCNNPTDSRVEALRHMIKQELHTATDVPSLNQLLIRCATQVFPPVSGQQRLATWQQPCMSIGIKGMWQARRQWKQLVQTHPDQVLQIGRAYQAFKQAHKAFKQAGKACKKRWFFDRIDELQAAAGRGDTRSLFAGVRAVAPKKAKTKVQLRDDKGQLQSADEQIKQLETYYRSLYAADKDPAVAGEARAPVTLCIDPGPMTQALSQLSPHKATPPGQATNSLWRLTADLTAPVLCKLASHWRQIPADWRDAWLVLVPKVPRPVSPRNLRPIGLTEPSGRAYARLLQQQLREYASSYLREATQYAYLGGREAAMAIHRVSQHCKYVQMKCSHVIRTVADRQECRPASAPHFAGVQLSLDLSNAFDLLNWRLIDRALIDAGVDSELRNQVLSWYHEVTYHIEHLNRTARVRAQQGLRQGCQLAPILWAMGMGYVFKSVASDPTNQVTTAWLQNNTTTYADDIHLMEVASSISHLDRMLHNFGTMLDALADNDMIINAAKSAVLLRHRGSFIKKWLRRHKQHTSEGDLLYLRTPKGREFRFPMRDQHTYLGVKISYHAMAKYTTLYRLQVANQAWQRLRGVLCSSGRLALAHRISLWKATVLPSLMYGLAAVDPEPKERTRMHSLIIKHVRAMAKSYAHMQQESSYRVLQRCEVLPAQAQLQNETEGLLRRLRNLAETTTLVSSDHMEALRVQAANIQVADMLAEADPAHHAGGDPGHRCHLCGRTFPSFRLLRSHEAKWHQLKTPAPEKADFDRFEHGTDGLPTCKHCGHRFRQWANLVQHIQRRRCQALRSKCAEDDSSSRPLTEQKSEPSPKADKNAALPQDYDTAQRPVSDRKCPPASASHCPQADSTLEDKSTTSVQQDKIDVPPPSPEPEPNPSLPLQEWSMVKRHLQAGSWTQLLECPEVQQYLQHHCPICMQWAATPNGLKCHMTNQHKEWTHFQPSIRKLLQGFRRHMVIPCRYCKQSKVNKDRHWQQCHVLSFCTFLWVQHDAKSSGRHGPGRAGTALLPEHGTTIRSTPGPQSSGLQQSSTTPGDGKAAESGGPRENQGQRRQGQGKIQGEGRISSRSIPSSRNVSLGQHVGLHQWFQRGSGEVDTVVERSPGISRLDRGENGPTYTDGSTSRTDLIGSSSGPDALSLRSEWRTGHDTSVMSGSRKVEEPQGGGTREAGVFPQISNVQAADDHIAGTAHRNIEEPTGNGPRQISQLGGPGGLLADSQMEWSQTKPRDRFHSPGNHHREPLESDCAGPQGHHRDIANSVQVYPKADGGSENGMGDFPDLRVSSPRRLSNLECSNIVDRTSSIPHDRVQIEARQAAVRCTGGQLMGMNTGANIGLQKLLKLSLHNDTNLCYLNSTAIAASWTILQAQLHDQGDLHLAPALKLLCNREDSALHRPLKLLSQLPWNVLLQGWRDIHRQHDAPELVTRLLPRLRVNRSDDRWEARISTVQGLHIRD